MAILAVTSHGRDARATRMLQASAFSLKTGKRAG